jgi:hypothetical protein
LGVVVCGAWFGAMMPMSLPEPGIDADMLSQSQRGMKELLRMSYIAELDEMGSEIGIVGFVVL